MEGNGTLPPSTSPLPFRKMGCTSAIFPHQIGPKNYLPWFPAIKFRIRVESLTSDMADLNFTCPGGFVPGTSTCTSVKPWGGENRSSWCGWSWWTTLSTVNQPEKLGPVEPAYQRVAQVNVKGLKGGKRDFFWDQLFENKNRGNLYTKHLPWRLSFAWKFPFPWMVFDLVGRWYNFSRRTNFLKYFASTSYRVKWPGSWPPLAFAGQEKRWLGRWHPRSLQLGERDRLPCREGLCWSLA